MVRRPWPWRDVLVFGTAVGLLVAALVLRGLVNDLGTAFAWAHALDGRRRDADRVVDALRARADP